MSRLAVLLLLVVALGLAAGCGGSTGPAPQKVQPVQVEPTEAIRSALQSIAQSGQVGSEGLTIQENIEKLRSTDAAKADVLAKDYQELQATTDPAKVKAKAAEMLGKL